MSDRQCSIPGPHLPHTERSRGPLFSCPGEPWPLVDVLAEDYVPTKQREGDQPLPTGDGDCVQDRVIAEMEESKRVGQERYGSVLRTFNGRSTIQDVAEEVRDLHVYLTQVRMESEADRETLLAVVVEALRPTGLNQSDREGCAQLAVNAVMGWVVGQKMAP